MCMDCLSIVQWVIGGLGAARRGPPPRGLGPPAEGPPPPLWGPGPSAEGPGGWGPPAPPWATAAVAREGAGGLGGRGLDKLFKYSKKC